VPEGTLLLQVDQWRRPLEVSARRQEAASLRERSRGLELLIPVTLDEAIQLPLEAFNVLRAPAGSKNICVHLHSRLVPQFGVVHAHEVGV
jgi:hypothetical protein